MAQFGLTLKPEIKKTWVSALRSGTYLQTEGILCDLTKEKPHYCCLGVLSDLQSLPYIEDHCSASASVRFYKFDEGSEDHEMIDSGWFSNLLEGTFEPDRVNNIDTPVTAAQNIASTLAQMNDARKTFTEIADWIETNL